MQVKRLEEIVARKLFERTKKTVNITSDGETLLSYANRILRINDEALSTLLEPEAQGLVRIGAPDDYMAPRNVRTRSSGSGSATPGIFAVRPRI